MKLNEYQEKAMATCMPSSRNFSYMMLNLVGEVGELSSKVAKAMRKEKMAINSNELEFILKNAGADERAELYREMVLEAGDILWQLACLCHVMGWDLEDVAEKNIEKLASRRRRGVIDGNGDDR